MFSVSENSREHTFTHEDIPVLTLAVKLPEVDGGTKRASGRVNKYYERLYNTLLKESEASLLPAAVIDFENMRERSRPFKEHRLRMTYETHTENDTLNVARTLYIRTNGTEGSEYLLKDCWDENGLPG